MSTEADENDHQKISITEAFEACQYLSIFWLESRNCCGKNWIAYIYWHTNKVRLIFLP